MSTKYPYTAWVLKPSFKPVETTFTENYSDSTIYGKWDKSESGKPYNVKNIFPTKAAAIAHANNELERLQADIDKRQATLDKRKAEVAKHT
ncbi:hypothetical protein ACM751_16290 [Pseudomonas aeruginosa]